MLGDQQSPSSIWLLYSEDKSLCFNAEVALKPGLSETAPCLPGYKRLKAFFIQRREKSCHGMERPWPGSGKRGWWGAEDGGVRCAPGVSEGVRDGAGRKREWRRRRDQCAVPGCVAGVSSSGICPSRHSFRLLRTNHCCIESIEMLKGLNQIAEKKLPSRTYSWTKQISIVKRRTFLQEKPHSILIYINHSCKIFKWLEISWYPIPRCIG